jgi:hypothetical protein
MSDNSTYYEFNNLTSNENKYNISYEYIEIQKLNELLHQKIALNQIKYYMTKIKSKL